MIHTIIGFIMIVKGKNKISFIILSHIACSNIHWIFAVILISGSDIFAQPINDSCFNASLLCPNTQLSANNINATTQCNGADGDCGFGSWCFTVQNSVWFKFVTNDAGGTATVSISSFTGNLDAALISSASECNSLEYALISCQSNVDTPFTLSSNSLFPNRVYWVMVDGAAGNQTNFQIAVFGSAVQWSVAQNSNNATCDNSCDGTATVVPSSGTSPYTYVWSTNPVQTTQTATGLCSGNYNVTVSDSIGCTALVPVSIGEAPPATASISSTDVQCATACNGTAMATLSSGQTPLTYLWSNSKITPTVTGLCAGNYSVTITDAQGCDTSASVIISVSPADTIIFTTTDTQCDCAQSGVTGSGTASVTLSSGLEKTYKWSNNKTTQSISALCNGVYSVTVTDSIGCKTIDSVTIGILSPAVASVTPEITCGSTCKAKATAEFTSLQTPFTYQWSNNKTTKTISNLCTGNYSLTVTDKKGCKDSTQFSISEPSPITNLTVTTTPVFCANKGAAKADITGGTSPFIYLWSNNETSDIIRELAEGTYSVTVTDSSNCTATASGTVDFKNCNMEGDIKFSPNDDGINDVWIIDNATVYPNNRVIVYNRWGQRVYTATGYNNTDIVWEGKYLGVAVPDGSYYYVIYQDNDNKKENEIHGSVLILR